MRGVALGAVLVCVLAGAAPAAERALPRATADRPDEVRGPQLHVVYAVPSDGADRALDTSGAIESSVAAFQRWLAAETGGATLRQDTFEGSLDVTFVRLTRTDAEIAARGAFVRDELEQLLRATGQIAPNKLYAVYYDGSSTFSCGGGAWPPALNGVVGAMYLHGHPPGAPGCDTNQLAAPGALPGYLDYAMLHELLHTLGAVPTCAPHHHLAGHVSDRPDDIMWAGSGAWQIPGHLDPGHDDYYGHGRTDCFDLARSEFLTSNPPPPPVLRVVSFVAGARARPGKTIEARLAVSLHGESVARGTARCAAKLAGRALRPIAASFAGSAARCRWRLPLTANRKRLVASVTAVVGSLSATRSFSRTVRRP
jgi:hypothetical protein